MKENIGWVVLAAALASIPFLGLSSYAMHVLILVIMWTVVGMSWNLLGGYCGQVSFGHAGFFGLGAYCAGILHVHGGLSAWWGLAACIPVVALFSWFMGWVVLRLRGPYFSLSTLAVGEVLRVTVQNLDKLTLGDKGILIRERTWVDKTWYFYIILALAVGTHILFRAILSSRMGYYFVAVREDQDAAETMGIDTTLVKTLALTVSGVVTSVAGAFYLNYMGYIDPALVFDLHGISILTIMIVMVGGVATSVGPLVGAAIMVFLAEWVRSIPRLGAAHQTLFGILLIVIVIYLPNGIVGDFGKLAGLVRRKGR